MIGPTSSFAARSVKEAFRLENKKMEGDEGQGVYPQLCE